MHVHHATFIQALEGKMKVSLTFDSKEDGHELVRLCAPMDFGPRGTAHDRATCYHFWDYESDSDRGPHPLGLLPGQVISIVATNDSFDPAEFVRWPPDWHHPRDWGEFS